MNIQKTIDSILGFFGEKISKTTTLSIQKLSELGANPPAWFSKVLSLFIGLLLIYIALRVGQKTAKIILWILGLIIIVSVAYSFFI